MRRTGSMGMFGNKRPFFVFKLEKTPGPGNYRLPSEFGYYESSKKAEFISKSAEKVPEEKKE